MAFIEAIAVVFGLACVILTIRQHIACWPTGLVMVILYIWIFREARLYSDMSLQIVYVFLQIYGWIQWTRGGTLENPYCVRMLSNATRLACAGLILVGTAVLGYGMNRWAGASLPYWDAATTVMSLVAQWFLARKVLESWVLWIVVDALSIGIYAVKGLYLTMGLYAVFLGLAISGLWVWRKGLVSR